MKMKRIITEGKTQGTKKKERKRPGRKESKNVKCKDKWKTI
jgi:hypothetical protein